MGHDADCPPAAEVVVAYYHILLREEVLVHNCTKWNEAFN